MDPRAFVGTPRKSISTSHTVNALSELQRVLNSKNPANSRVGAGMRSMASISKALGKGGKIPYIGDEVDSDVKWVLGQLGIDSQTLFKVGQRNPGLAAQGTSASQTIFGKVISGIFGNVDIPIFQPLFENIYQQGVEFYKPPAPPLKVYEVSHYSDDVWKLAPKYKFLFVVQFTFNPPYFQDYDVPKRFAFLVQQSTRPSVKYHAESVNYYNFRTSMTTKAEFEDMKMSFIDAGDNSAMAFYKGYLQAMSPVTNYSTAEQAHDLESQGMNTTITNDARVPGMTTTIPTISRNSGSTGHLANEQKTILQSVRVYQIYNYGKKANVFSFFNPRILTLELDELGMDKDDGPSMLNLQFNYETMYIDLDKNMQDLGLSDLTNVGLYPMRFIGSPDMMRYAERINGGAVTEPPTPSEGSVVEQLYDNVKHGLIDTFLPGKN